MREWKQENMQYKTFKKEKKKHVKILVCHKWGLARKKYMQYKTSKEGKEMQN